MIELKCKNCNSNDFTYKDGLWVCNSCGSKYIPEKEEFSVPQEYDSAPRTHKISFEETAKNKRKKLEKKLCAGFRRYRYTDAIDEDEADRRRYLLQMVDEISQDLMRINPDNPYSAAGKAFLLAYRGIKNSDDANRFVDVMENAIKHSDLEAKIHLWNELGLLMERFGSRVYTKAQDQKERIYHLVDALREYNPKYLSYPKLEEFYVARDGQKANEYDHSVAVLKSFDASKYPVKHWYDYFDGGNNGRKKEYWRLLAFPLAGLLIFLGLITMLVSPLFGVGLIVLSVMAIKQELSHFKK